MKKNGCIAIVLAAGQGKRMESSLEKQYLEIGGKPLIYYSLKAFEESEIIDKVVLVVGKGQVGYVQKEIVDAYCFHKVEMITEGGKERYESVYEGLKKVESFKKRWNGIYVFVHDCARPFVTEEILVRAYECVCEHMACVVGMPSKDTMKIADEKAFAIETPDRNRVWTIQTPQVFERQIIFEAYTKLMQQEEIQVTDDAMVVEQMLNVPVKLTEGSYKNIKITTPEDLDIAAIFLRKK